MASPALSIVEIANGFDVVPTLDELADRVRSADAACAAAAQSAVEYAIKAGEALIEAKKQIPHKQWTDWLVREFPNRHLKTLRLYMRVAAHAEKVREANPATITAAHRMLVGEAVAPATQELHDEAKRLRAEGLPVTEIASKLNRSTPTINEWLDPKAADKRRARRRQRSRQATRAIYRKDRDSAAKRAGGSIAHGYAAVRKALEALEAAQLEESDAEAKTEISQAIERLHYAEDHVVRASKLSVGDRKVVA